MDMYQRIRIILSSIVFIIYQFWGGYLIYLCMHDKGESCIAGLWWLLFTGLPSTLILIILNFGHPGIPQLILYSLIGGLQWFLLTRAIFLFVERRHKKRIENPTSR
jgi:hypothetical protein